MGLANGLETLPEGQNCRKLGPSCSRVPLLGKLVLATACLFGLGWQWGLSSHSHSLPSSDCHHSYLPWPGFLPFQRAPGSGEDSAPSHLNASDDLDVLRTRHARHSRTRTRRLL